MNSPLLSLVCLAPQGIGATVQGGVTQGQGWLTLIFNNPGQAQTGEFGCEVNTLETVHPVAFETTVEVSEEAPTMADVVGALQQIKHKDSATQATINQLQQTVNKLSQKIYFSAVSTMGAGVKVSANQVIVFDKVFVNEGTSYNGHTGIFTCPLAGDYKFDVSCLSGAHGHVHMSLYKNQMTIFNVWADGGNLESSSNSAVIRLAKGDKVEVKARADSTLWSTGSDSYLSFTGFLVAPF